jgi:DNA repair protein RadC
MSIALKCAATSILLCHNHPSGNLQPSKADIELTNKIKQAAELFDIKLIEHLIISSESYYSFADEG